MDDEARRYREALKEIVVFATSLDDAQDRAWAALGGDDNDAWSEEDGLLEDDHAIDATGWAEAAFPKRRAVTNCIPGGLETTNMAIARRWEANGAEVRYIDG
jgi:hypothetical protein